MYRIESRKGEVLYCIRICTEMLQISKQHGNIHRSKLFFNVNLGHSDSNSPLSSPPTTFHHLSSYLQLPPYISAGKTRLTLSVNTAYHHKRCSTSNGGLNHTGAWYDPLSRSIFPAESLCKASDWYIGTVVGVKTCEEGQTFSLMVINANWASMYNAKSILNWIYFWVDLFLALPGEDHREWKNLLC